MAVNTPAWRPQLVALDIDGTLLIPEHNLEFGRTRLNDSVREAVLRVVRAGVPVVLASGRTPLSMTKVADRLGLAELYEAEFGQPLHMVSSNGAVIVNYEPLRVLHEVTFDANDAVHAVLEQVPQAAVAVEEHGVGYRVNRPFPPGELEGEMIVSDLTAMIAEPVSRVIIRDPEASVDDFMGLAHRLGLHGTNYYIGWTAWLDLAPEGISKASGLDWMCDHFGVAPTDILAIGDGRNDVEMFEFVGHAVAMGQAPDVLKAVADEVTADVFDDGVVPILNRWFG